MTSEEGNDGSSFNLSSYPTGITHVIIAFGYAHQDRQLFICQMQSCQDIKDLKAYKIEQTQKTTNLEKKLVFFLSHNNY